MQSKLLFKTIKTILSSIKYSPGIFVLYWLVCVYDVFYSVFLVIIMTSIISCVESSNIDGLYWWSRIFALLIFIKLILSIFSDALYSSLFNKIEFGLSKKYLHLYILFDNTKVEEYGTGKMNNILFKGISSMGELVRLSISISAEVLATLYIFILVLIKVPNTYYFLGFIGLFFIVMFLLGKGLGQIVKIRKKSKELNIELEGRKIKILMSKFEIMQNAKIHHETQELGKLYSKLNTLWIYGNLKKSSWQVGADGIMQLFYIIVFVVIGAGIIEGNYTIATFTLLVWILQILTKYSWQIRGYMRDTLSHWIHVEKLLEIIDTIPTYPDDSMLSDFRIKRGDIELKNVCYGYIKENKVLNDFSLHLQGGKKYAFVGPSGGGKSTLVKLLAGYITPESGTISIDDQTLTQVKLKTYHKNIGYLSQDPSVFDGSILENLLYALDTVPSDEAMKEVIQQSKCEFIYDLPNQLETQIGEKGVKLSGGQKQRLAIAKIMLKNPNIILLDEPTSALDSFNEEEVSIAFANLFENKTVVVVAHRLQTVKNSDIIYYLEKGIITESGTHQQLLEKRGKYYKMIELQSGF